MLIRNHTAQTFALSLVLLAVVCVGSANLLAQEQTGPAAPMWQDEVTTTVLAPFSRLLYSFVRVVPRLIAMGLTLLVFWGVAALVKQMAQAIARPIPNPTIRHFIVQLSYYSVWAIGAVAALDSLGFDAQAVATGLGLTGIALGFALKDILSNLVSGLLMLVTRSFEIGDQIVVGDTEGTVERIEVRVTHIRTYDGRLVLVPNAEVFGSRVVNNTASPLRRASIIIPLDYRQDVTLALRVIDDAMKGTHGVAVDPPPSVRLRDLTPTHLAFEARFWADARRPDFVNTTCHVRVAIVHALTRAGVELPNVDSRIVVLPGDIERWRAVLMWKAEPTLQ